MPSFEYKGIVCGFAGFKEHCAIMFWKSAIMKDKEILLSKESKGQRNFIEQRKQRSNGKSWKDNFT